jgi:hypothetical protein
MAIVYEKIDSKTLRVTETKSETKVEALDVRALKKRKQFLKAEIDKINELLAQAQALNIEEAL